MGIPNSPREAFGRVDENLITLAHYPFACSTLSCEGTQLCTSKPAGSGQSLVAVPSSGSVRHVPRLRPVV